MIDINRKTVTFDNNYVVQYMLIIEASGVCELIDRINARHRGTGGRSPGPVRYSMKGVLVAQALLIDDGRTPSLAKVFRTLTSSLTEKQRRRLGVTVSPEYVRLLRKSRVEHRLEYGRFQQWLYRKLQYLDSHFDFPARKITNGEAKRIYADRDTKARIRAKVATHLCHAVVNKIVAASILDKHPEGYEGDIVVDETTYDVAKVNRGDGNKDTAMRAAVPGAPLYRRGGPRVLDGPGDDAKTKADKMAFGVGVTAISRVGSPGNMRRVTPLITSLAFGPTTSGSVEAVTRALRNHHANGCGRPEAKGGKNRRWPYFTTDMGYNTKDGWAELALLYEYGIIGRYPNTWHTVSELQEPAGRRGAKDVSLGPLQISGDLYCPAAAKLIKGPTSWVEPGSILLADNGNKHDRWLAALTPLLMGVNSRLKLLAPRAGRPSLLGERTKVPKIDLVCPAVQGRVRCPHKPMSMTLKAADRPTLNPDWPAESKKCCSQSQVTVTLNPNQFKRHQSAFPPGTWEHTFLYESYRAITEQMFGQIKSPHGSNVQALNWGPRREPMIMLTVAMIVTVNNHKRQLNGTPVDSKIDCYERRMAKLKKLLGRAPTLTPPRT